MLEKSDAYRNVLNFTVRPKMFYDTKERNHGLNTLVTYMNFRYCNETVEKSKVLKSDVRHVLTKTCKAVLALTFCALFRDVIDDIVASLDKIPFFKVDHYVLEELIFDSICIPSFAIGNLFRMLVPLPRKEAQAGAQVVDDNIPLKMRALTGRKMLHYIQFKDSMFALMVGAKFLTEYFWILRKIVTTEETFYKNHDPSNVFMVKQFKDNFIQVPTYMPRINSISKTGTKPVDKIAFKKFTLR